MLSTFTWILICIFLLVLKYGILAPIEDKRLFRMYETRDNVALAAIEGKISQDSSEYKFVIEKINFQIYYMKNNYDFSILIKNLISCPEEVKKYYESMFNLIKQYDILQDSYEMSFGYFRKSLNFRLSFFYHFIITPFYYFLRVAVFILTFIEKLSNLGENLINNLKARVTIINSISDEYCNYKNNILNKI